MSTASRPNQNVQNNYGKQESYIPFFLKNGHILNIVNISLIIMGVGKEFGTIFDFYLFKY